jgi:N-acyl-phosphatidylethanolamine-hydrolysing phospholipase D
MRVLACLATLTALGGCAGHEPPPPVRGLLVAAIAGGSVLHVFPGTGAPSTRPVGGAANRDGAITWLGHSGFAVRLGGRTVLLDPMLSPTVETPLGIAPRRLASAPDVSVLDRLDAVLISHADIDHLDRPTLRRLAGRFPAAALVVPPGVGALVADLGFAAVHEIAPYGSRALGTVEVTAVPVHHYGRRDFVGVVRTPALGYALRVRGRRILFTGDTADGPSFAEIRRRLGRFDVALVPIGAYEPPAAFADVHATPEQAIRIATVLGARTAIAHHWGTFAFGPDTPADAVRRFLAAARAAGVRAIVPEVGETVRAR